MNNLLISVAIREDEQTLTKAEVEIQFGPDTQLPAGKIIDACQRAVAQCIYVLEEKLPTEKSR